jgi:lipid II:glycine glycyltransferase (peptidoglycan interpeptide bridge formation enzyme)
MPEVSLTQWNAFLDGHPRGHFLQTGEWGELKTAFGWEARRLIADGVGAQVLFRRLPLGLTVAYVPKPDLADLAAAGNHEFWTELDALCAGRRAIVCRVEPDGWEADDSLLTHGPESGLSDRVRLRPSPHNTQPRRTLVVDLLASEDSILERMRPKCRYNIRLAAKKDVTVRPWDDLAAFHRMVTETGRRDRFGVHSLEYYRLAFRLFHGAGLCELLVAEHQGRPLAALMVFARGQRAWYVYGASTNDERARMPNYLLQWEAMRWAKWRGCTEYDLWGAPDEDEQKLEANFEGRDDGLWGVYRFKRGFGGDLRRSVQAVDRVYMPWPYQLHRLQTRASERA